MRLRGCDELYQYRPENSQSGVLQELIFVLGWGNWYVWRDTRHQPRSQMALQMHRRLI